MQKSSQANLRKVFDDTTRDDPHACEICFPGCESSMYRARKTVEPGIPLNASEFCDIIPTTQLGKFFKFSVTSDNQTGGVFFSERMSGFLSEVSNIQFDGTFYTVSKQFTQLWTVFVSVGRHSLPAIHCLMTGKSQGQYQSLHDNLSSKIPNFIPVTSMSDWEAAPRNAFKEVLPLIKNYGCVVPFYPTHLGQNAKNWTCRRFHA